MSPLLAQGLNSPPFALFPHSGILFPFMTIPFALFLLSILSASALAYDIPNVTYRSCYDGDTCRFDIPNIHPLAGKNIPVRLAGIDTPEKHGKCKEEKDLAIQARDLVQTTLEQAQSITLKNAKGGKYFLIVAEVWADGVNVSEVLIQEGVAVPYEGGTKGKDWCG